MKRKSRTVRFLLLILVLFILFSALLLYRVDPLTVQLAEARISDVASNIINDAISQELREKGAEYEDFVHIIQDENGGISALSADMQNMNRLKTDLLIRLDNDLTTISTDEVSIPMGNLTGVQLLSGVGPYIPVKIVSISSSDAEFRGSFTSAGINQTLHRIMLDVSLELLILLPSGTVTQTVSTEVCVAETVLVGAVPESFTYFYSDNHGSGE